MIRISLLLQLVLNKCKLALFIKREMNHDDNQEQDKVDPK